MGPDFPAEKSRHGILFMKTFYNVFNAIICCAKEARASIVLDNEWGLFVLQNWAKRQGPVAQKVHSAIHRINLYPVDSAMGFPNTYPLESDLPGE